MYKSTLELFGNIFIDKSILLTDLTEILRLYTNV